MHSVDDITKWVGQLRISCYYTLKAIIIIVIYIIANVPVGKCVVIVIVSYSVSILSSCSQQHGLAQLDAVKEDNAELAKRRKLFFVFLFCACFFFPVIN